MLRQMHACCAARNSMGVLLLGPSGIGKSDLLLRLIHVGYDLVADDRVVMEDDIASAPPSLAGLIEIRGLGIVKMPFVGSARIHLVVRLVAPGSPFPRWPEEPLDAETGLRLLWLNPMLASAVARIDTALDCLSGRYHFFSEDDKTLLSKAGILL